MGFPATGVRTLGYDPVKGKFVGTWIYSMSPYLWTYEGSLDATGKILSLEGRGPKPETPGELARYRDSSSSRARTIRFLRPPCSGRMASGTPLSRSPLDGKVAVEQSRSFGKPTHG